MTTESIHFRSGYKYQLARQFLIEIPIKPVVDIDEEYVRLDTSGFMLIDRGYSWDGPSGPVIDTKNNLRASLIHDALYQLIRIGRLSKVKFKDQADKLFMNMCIEDGVKFPFPQIYYFGLNKFGEPATDPKNIKKVKAAPRIKGQLLA